MKHNHPPKIHNFHEVKNKPVIRDKYFRKLHTWEGRRADKKLKACPICKVVWEVIMEDKNKKCEYYHNFPTYGKLKVVCNRCLWDKIVSHTKELKK